ncbi:hypothetical protein O8B93_26080 [Agrobacterium rhizogenes]|uniref:hypothetical protein n=1 Tax=Rhizobium rhizogenes TaxID=359 RepID=UPI0022B65495|nr:hypothetical protein [Rhizobium rhizogenes]MCZ7451041.1 hypothetical protein [Rhizobium rhizogenes]
MKLKAVRSSFGKYGNVRRDDLIEPEDKSEAKALVASGLYVEYDEKAERQAKEEREAKALADAEAAKAAEAENQKAGRALADKLDELTAENATLVQTVADRDATIVDLRTQLDKQAEELGKIPGLENAIKAKDAAIAIFEQQLSALDSKDGVTPADDGSSNETGKKSAGKKDGK